MVGKTRKLVSKIRKLVSRTTKTVSKTWKMVKIGVLGYLEKVRLVRKMYDMGIQQNWKIYAKNILTNQMSDEKLH